MLVPVYMFYHALVRCCLSSGGVHARCTLLHLTQMTIFAPVQIIKSAMNCILPGLQFVLLSDRILDTHLDMGLTMPSDEDLPRNVFVTCSKAMEVGAVCEWRGLRPVAGPGVPTDGEVGKRGLRSVRSERAQCQERVRRPRPHQAARQGPMEPPRHILLAEYSAADGKSSAGDSLLRPGLARRCVRTPRATSLLRGCVRMPLAETGFLRCTRRVRPWS